MVHFFDVVFYSVNVVVFIVVEGIDAVHIDAAFDGRSVNVVVIDIVAAIAAPTGIPAVASVEPIQLRVLMLLTLCCCRCCGCSC